MCVCGKDEHFVWNELEKKMDLRHLLLLNEMFYLASLGEGGLQFAGSTCFVIQVSTVVCHYGRSAA